MESSNLAFARGGISSGGGELIGDRANPWFLQNTSEVSYCLVISPGSMSLPEAQIQTKLEAAFDYWAHELQKAGPGPGPYAPPYTTITVGTQKFRRKACDPTVDIIFQLGGLTAEQRRIINDDLSMIIADTQRLDYDRVHLKGQGFVYVASDLGGDIDRNLSIPAGAWSWNHGDALYGILAHELGQCLWLLRRSAGQRRDELYLCADLDAGRPR